MTGRMRSQRARKTVAPKPGKRKPSHILPSPFPSKAERAERTACLEEAELETKTGSIASTSKPHLVLLSDSEEESMDSEEESDEEDMGSRIQALLHDNQHSAGENDSWDCGVVGVRESSPATSEEDDQEFQSGWKACLQEEEGEEVDDGEDEEAEGRYSEMELELDDTANSSLPSLSHFQDEEEESEAQILTSVSSTSPKRANCPTVLESCVAASTASTAPSNDCDETGVLNEKEQEAHHQLNPVSQIEDQLQDLLSQLEKSASPGVDIPSSSQASTSHILHENEPDIQMMGPGPLPPAEAAYFQRLVAACFPPNRAPIPVPTAPSPMFHRPQYERGTSSVGTRMRPPYMPPFQPPQELRPPFPASHYSQRQEAPTTRRVIRLKSGAGDVRLLRPGTRIRIRPTPQLQRLLHQRQLPMVHGKGKHKTAVLNPPPPEPMTEKIMEPMMEPMNRSVVIRLPIPTSTANVEPPPSPDSTTVSPSIEPDSNFVTDASQPQPIEITVSDTMFNPQTD